MIRPFSDFVMGGVYARLYLTLTFAVTVFKKDVNIQKKTFYKIILMHINILYFWEIAFVNLTFAFCIVSVINFTAMEKFSVYAGLEGLFCASNKLMRFVFFIQLKAAVIMINFDSISTRYEGWSIMSWYWLMLFYFDASDTLLQVTSFVVRARKLLQT